MMFHHRVAIITLFRRTTAFVTNRSLQTLTSQNITGILARNQAEIPRRFLPKCIKSLECNQLASNDPIEDRLRISTVHLPGLSEPTLILGVFDGHGNGTTADLISRRLFNYIALSLHPEPKRVQITDSALKSLIVDLHNCPTPLDDTRLRHNELDSLSCFKDDLTDKDLDVAERLKFSFNRCDADLSREIQENLMSGSDLTIAVRNYYLNAAVSGCCAIVMVIHRGVGYVASTGDCRAVFGTFGKSTSNREDEATAEAQSKPNLNNYNFSAIDLNDEHNCDNINEIKRLANSHPKSEQNTMIKQERLLGHLMPFRAFGDFNYKWSVEAIKACGITRAFGPRIIPYHYDTPPYLVAEPDVNEIESLSSSSGDATYEQRKRCLVIASDGLWERFESSRDVIESVADHSVNHEMFEDDYDPNCATHILRAALRSSSQVDYGLDLEELKKVYHLRLETALTLPKTSVRMYRDDITLAVLRLD